jgi:hypothetical protein
VSLAGLGFQPKGDTEMEEILAFVQQWGDTIVDILNRIIAAIEAFLSEGSVPK